MGYTLKSHLSFLLPSAGLLAAVVFLSGCGGNSAPASTPASEDESSALDAQVETLLLATDSFEDIIAVSGVIDATDDAVLSAQSSGTVKMMAPLGRRVSRGEVIASLDRDLLVAAVNQAKAAVDNAAASLTLTTDEVLRLEPLLEDSIISASRFQTAVTMQIQSEASLRQAEAILSQAEVQLNNTFIVAPFAGTIEEHRVAVGEQAIMGSPIIRVINTQKVKVTVGIPERYAGDIEVGTEVSVITRSLTEIARTGKVTFAGNSINPRNRTFTIEAEISNSNGQLKPEMIADVHISRQRLDSVLTIPRSAVVKDEDGNSVYVVDHSDGSSVVNRRSVTLGAAYAERVVVLGGLQEGEEVVILGQNILTDGLSVEVIAQYERLDSEGIPVPVTQD